MTGYEGFTYAQVTKLFVEGYINYTTWAKFTYTIAYGHWPQWN